jgi:hypothetical protein
MKLKTKFAFSLIALCLCACNQEGKNEKMISLGGAPIDNPSTVARIREGSMLVRGIDQNRIELKDIPNPFSAFVFAVSPGKHSLLAMNIQSGHLIPTENMRCYVIDAELKANVAYRIDEDKSNWRAVLKREDSGEEIASAKLLDQQSSFGNPCQWK